jgi:hypothetical protein
MKYKRGLNKFKIHWNQKKEIEMHFKCFTCVANNNELNCRGVLQPIDIIEPYTIQIQFKANTSPRVYVKSPKIIADSKIHVYPKGNLCLYYPKEFVWTNDTSIAKNIIPWINEWIVYYENYKINGGKWLGPEAPHSPLAKK